MHAYLLAMDTLQALAICMLGLSVIALYRYATSMEARLRVVERLLDARGLLPEPPREARSGVEQLRVARTEDGTW